MMYRSYFLSNCFTSHSHSLREEAHTRVACTLYFRTNKFEDCLGFSLKGAQTLGGPGRRGVQKGLSDSGQSIRKKISHPAHISTPNLLVALIRVLSPPPNLSYISFSHHFLSVLTCFSVSVASVNFFESTSPSLVLYDTGGL
jgi:hypothetical protein